MVVVAAQPAAREATVAPTAVVARRVVGSVGVESADQVAVVSSAAQMVAEVLVVEVAPLVRVAMVGLSVAAAVGLVVAAIMVETDPLAAMAGSLVAGEAPPFRWLCW